MKTEYTMEQADFDRLTEIAKRPSTPVMKFGDHWSGSDKQEDSYAVWKEMGKRMGFVWDSAEPSGNDPLKFKATPL